MSNTKINLAALSKQDLINVIAEMHDTIQDWNNGWGFNEKDAKVLIHVGNLCVNDYIERNGRNKQYINVLPNIEEYNGAKIVEDILPYISSKEKGKFAQDCSNEFNKSQSITNILKISGWKNNNSNPHFHGNLSKQEIPNKNINNNFIQEVEVIKKLQKIAIEDDKLISVGIQNKEYTPNKLDICLDEDGNEVIFLEYLGGLITNNILVIDKKYLNNYLNNLPYNARLVSKIKTFKVIVSKQQIAEWKNCSVEQLEII